MHVVEAALFEALAQSRRPARPAVDPQRVKRSEDRQGPLPLSILSRMTARMTGLANRLRHPGRHRLQGMS